MELMLFEFNNSNRAESKAREAFDVLEKINDASEWIESAEYFDYKLRKGRSTEPFLGDLKAWLEWNSMIRHCFLMRYCVLSKLNLGRSIL